MNQPEIEWIEGRPYTVGAYKGFKDLQPVSATLWQVLKRFKNAFYYYDGANWRGCRPPMPPTADEAYIYRNGWVKVELNDEV